MFLAQAATAVLGRSKSPAGGQGAGACVISRRDRTFGEYKSGGTAVQMSIAGPAALHGRAVRA